MTPRDLEGTGAEIFPGQYLTTMRNFSNTTKIELIYESALKDRFLEKMIVAGVMTGTSVDGIDVAIVEFKSETDWKLIDAKEKVLIFD